MQFIEMAEAGAKYSGTSQVQLKVVIKKYNYFINQWIFSCQAKNKKYYYVVIAGNIFDFTYLVSICNFVIIHICYGYLNKIKVPLVSDT